MNIYNADNLLVMKSIENEHVQLIYCDVLYGTGRDLNDFVDLKQDYEEVKEHYMPRFKEMKRILKDTGLLYIHCDWHISHWLRLMLDKVFGMNRFLGEIIWYYDNGGGRSRKFVNKKHDNILVYCKSDKYVYNEIKVPYKSTSAYGKSGIVSNGKQYSPKEDGKNIDDVWSIPIVNPMSKERVDYVTQKPKALLKRIIKASSNEGDVVADFYMGSGTTAVVCKEMNREFIGCDISLKAVEMAWERLK